MAFTTPSSQTWTLRLKSHKTTVLLHVDPLQTFTSIKEQLYKALEDTGLKNDGDSIEQISLPPSPADIELGRPVNTNDPQKGFQLGEWEYSPLEEEDGDEPPNLTELLQNSKSSRDAEGAPKAKKQKR